MKELTDPFDGDLETLQRRSAAALTKMGCVGSTVEGAAEALTEMMLVAAKSDHCGYLELRVEESRRDRLWGYAAAVIAFLTVCGCFVALGFAGRAAQTVSG